MLKNYERPFSEHYFVSLHVVIINGIKRIKVFNDNEIIKYLPDHFRINVFSRSLLSFKYKVTNFASLYEYTMEKVNYNISLDDITFYPNNNIDYIMNNNKFDFIKDNIFVLN